MKPWAMLLTGAAIQALIIHNPMPNSRGEPAQLPQPLGDKKPTEAVSPSWAGAWMTAPGNQTFTSTFSQFQILEPSMPAGADDESTYIVAEWIGLADDDGLASSTDGVIVQAGILFTGVGGAFTVGAWWEWYPQDEQSVDLPISWGDTISISITMTSQTTANIIIANTSKKVEQSVTVQGQAANLRYACFIVEDPPPHPFLHFADVAFEQCRASVGDQNYGLDNSSRVVDMVDSGSGKTKASGSIADSSTVKVTYSG